MIRLIPFAGLVMTGVLSLGCNAAPVEPADPDGASDVAGVPFGASFREANAQAAVIIRNSGSCALLNGEGELITADRNLQISTFSARDNTTIICKVKNVANPTGRAVRYTGEKTGRGCGILRPDGFVVTMAWTETVSASGNATLRCHFRLGVD